MIKDASAAGKHIFSEKPLGQTLKCVMKPLAAAKESGYQASTWFYAPFDAAYAMAKKKIDEGAIGQPVVFHGVGRDPQLPGPGIRQALEQRRLDHGHGCA